MADNKFALGELAFLAKGDRLLIVEDEFKSGYECDSCGGKGARTCSECSGGGRSPINPIVRCSACQGSGTVTCDECGGKGGLLVAPETAQRRPTTGEIVSVGPTCKDSKVGDRVMFSNFAGYVVDLTRAGKNISLRILHESEILCGMEGHLDLKGLRGKSEIATFQS